jgi:DNA polymerase-3 subunit gamma/tau
LSQSGPQAERDSAPLALGRFEDLVLLAEDKRDIKLRTNLRRHVRLVSFADGRMEFSLAGNPPADFVSDLSAKLQQWTGRRWMIATSRADGAPTLEEAERQKAGSLTADALADPDVVAIRARFPGARVIDVRLRSDGEEAETLEPAVEPAAEPE